MSEITEISPQVKDKNRCNIYVDGSFYCGMKLETAVKSRLKVGQHVEKAFLDEIQLENEKSEAMDRALNFLSASMKTGRQVTDYLKKKGYVPAVCEYVRERLEGYGYVDDTEYCRAYLASASKTKGRRLLEAELKKRGAKAECVEEALASLEGGADSAFAVLSKYMKNREFSRENLSRGFKYLMGKGFDYDDARAALERLGAETEEE